MTDLDKFLLTIGKIAVNFNVLEMSVRRLLWSMININNLAIGEAVTKSLDSSGLEILGNRLIPTLGLTHEQTTRFKSAFSKFSEVRNQRNSNLHQTLRIPNEANGPISRAWPQHHKKGTFHSDGQPIMMSAVLKTNQDCFDLTDSFDRLLKELHCSDTDGGVA